MQLKKLKQLLVVAGLVSISATSFAKGDQSKFYFGLDGGLARTNALVDTAHENLPVIANDFQTGVRSKTDRGTTFFRGNIGRQITPTAAIELGYFQTGNWKSEIHTSNGYPLGNMKANASGFELAGIVKPFDNGVFLKGGVHRSTTEVSLSGHLAEIYGQSAKTTGTGYLIGLGYETQISNTVSTNIAYTHYAKLGGESGVKADVVTAGLKYKF